VKRDSERKLIATIVATLLAIIAGAFFFVTLPAPVDRKLHAQIGAALADQAAGLVRPGGKITLICRDTETFPQPAMDILLKIFKGRFSKGTTVTTLAVQVDPLRPASAPPGDFFELIRKSKPEDVVVSLLGPPILSDEQRFVLGGVRPRIVALCAGPSAGDIDLRRFFDAGLLHAAVVSQSFVRTTSDTARIIPKDFSSLYRTYRSNDLAALPRSPASAAEFSTNL
jgi:hypothetical protein